MKSFDWRNMELRDFFGLVAIGILLFTVIFAFGFCYFNRDYAEKNKEELISVYLDLPRMNHIQNESYEVLKARKLLVYYISGRISTDITDQQFADYYKSHLLLDGWKLDNQNWHKSKYHIIAHKGEFSLEIFKVENDDCWRIYLDKEDWLYKKRF